MRYKDDPHTERIKIFINGRRPINNTGVQINRKELTRTFMMISNSEKPFSLHGLNNNISAFSGLTL